MARRKQRWTYSAGERPHTVSVYEREPGGVLQAAAWDPSLREGRGGQRRLSLGHRDQERAEAYALKEAAKLKEGVEDIASGRVKLSRVFALYLKWRTPRKTDGEQQADERRVEMWTRVFGGNTDPHRVSSVRWDSFVRDRRSGAIDARANPVPEGERRPVKARAVEADCHWVRWVFNWASKWRTAEGHYLMRENPARGFEVPKEENPQRPVATHDRLEAVRKVSDQVMMESRWGKRREERSYLSELLDVAAGTGRRVSPVCKLRYVDLRLEKTREAPYGSIRWPRQTDKMGRETVSPIGPDVREALERILGDRPGIGEAPLFPSPENAQAPISRHLADAWLRKAEKLAELEPQRGSLWHAYRRKWATERKHLPDTDVAKAGGWKTVETLKNAYQQADPETTLRVVLEPRQLREMR